MKSSPGKRSNSLPNRGSRPAVASRFKEVLPIMKMIRCVFITFAFAVLVRSAAGQHGVPSIAVPRHDLFPGVTNAKVTQANINTTI